MDVGLKEGFPVMITLVGANVGVIVGMLDGDNDLVGSVDGINVGLCVG
jgi:hypothetical protein